MSKPPSSAARRNAEAMLNQTKKRESSFKLEQEREHDDRRLLPVPDDGLGTESKGRQHQCGNDVDIARRARVLGTE